MNKIYTHYYFKFGEKNILFKDYLSQPEKEIQLSIFFDTWKDKSKKTRQFAWNVEDYYNHQSEFRKTFNERHHNDKKQITMFFNCGNKENIANTIFWIFDETKVYALQPIHEICNGKADGILETYKPEDGKSAKTIPCKVEKTFLREKLPESFATINSNRAYNIKTIEIFKEKEKEIANFLFNKQQSEEKMEIEEDKMLDYLSPIQFETLIFLIFHHNKIFCSTYRGGTREGVDLKIVVDENSTLEKFKEKGTQYVQIKMYDHKKNDAYILIHLGSSDYNKNIFGKDWINKQIEKLPELKNWLIKSLDFYEIKN